MNEILQAMLHKYKCHNQRDYENALKEIIQEVALLGLWRSKFFEVAAFYGGTALRILYGLDRFSEDLDFSLLSSNPSFAITDYLDGIQYELQSLGFVVTIDKKDKSNNSTIQPAFIKTGTKEHLLRIKAPTELHQTIHRDQSLKIKLEVDIDPPADFKTEGKLLLLPVPFTVNTYQLADLFAGKIHALICRPWKNRVKGRDWYDFVWFVARDTPIHLTHLQQRLLQTGHWGKNEKLSQQDIISLLEVKINLVDFEQAKHDVLPFLQDSSRIDLWSKDFFWQVAQRIKVVV